MGGGLTVAEPSGLVELIPAHRGHVEYESGHHGDVWLDLDPLFLRPRRLQPYLSELARRLAGHRPDVICGPLVGGAFVAQAVAGNLDATCCHSTRRAGTYELPAALRPAVRGRRVALVDDVVNAGSAVLATAAAVRAAGGVPVCLGALLARAGSAAGVSAAAGTPFEYLAAVPSPLWTAAECPLCTAGIPLDPPPD